MQVDPQHSMSLQPDSVIVWMNDVIEMLIAMMIDASAVITINNNVSISFGYTRAHAHWE